MKLASSLHDCGQRVEVQKRKFHAILGKTRLEPIGIIALCVIMSGAAAQMVILSIRRIMEIARAVPLEEITIIPLNNTEAILISDAKLYVLSEEVANQLEFDTEPIAICSISIGLQLCMQPCSAAYAVAAPGC